MLWVSVTKSVLPSGLIVGSKPGSTVSPSPVSSMLVAVRVDDKKQLHSKLCVKQPVFITAKGTVLPCMSTCTGAVPAPAPASKPAAGATKRSAKARAFFEQERRTFKGRASSSSGSRHAGNQSLQQNTMKMLAQMGEPAKVPGAAGENPPDKADTAPDGF